MRVCLGGRSISYALRNKNQPPAPTKQSAVKESAVPKVSQNEDVPQCNTIVEPIKKAPAATRQMIDTAIARLRERLLNNPPRGLHDCWVSAASTLPMAAFHGAGNDGEMSSSSVWR